MLTHSFLKVSIETNKQMAKTFLKLAFLFEFCFSLHGMQFVCTAFTHREVLFQFQWQHGTTFSWYCRIFFLYINCVLLQIVYPSTINSKHSNECCTFPYLLLFFIFSWAKQNKIRVYAETHVTSFVYQSIRLFFMVLGIYKFGSNAILL